MSAPRTLYARSGEVHLAYEKRHLRAVRGDGHLAHGAEADHVLDPEGPRVRGQGGHSADDGQEHAA